MDQEFFDFIDRLNSLGYEADNEDLMMLDAYAGNGYVLFYSGKTKFSLLFSNYRLDLNSQGNVVKFVREFRIKTEIRSAMLRLEGIEDESKIELTAIVLPNRLESTLKEGVELMNATEIV